MHIERSIDISAPPQRVWAVLSDVERWHEWTESVTSVTLDGGPFGVGSRARVVQPRLQPATFEVTEFNPGRNFTWKTATGGIAAVAGQSSSRTPAARARRSRSISRASR